MHLSVMLLASMMFTPGVGAEIREQIVVNMPPDRLAGWLQSHPAAVTYATHCTLVSRRGNLSRVLKETPKGIFEFTLQETLTQERGGFHYVVKLVQDHRGGMRSYKMDCWLMPYGTGRSVLTLYVVAEIDAPRVRYLDVKTSLAQAMKGFQRLVAGLQ